MTIILSNEMIFKKFTERVLGKFVLKWILKIPLHLAYVATLLCETLMSAKQAVNDKLPVDPRDPRAFDSSTLWPTHGALGLNAAQ